MTPDVPVRWAIAGTLVGGMAALLLFAPAAWLAAGVSSVSSGRVQLAATRGTVWDGSARLLLTGGEGSRDTIALPGRVNWRIAPAWPGLASSIRADCCTPRPIEFTLSPRWSGWRLDMASIASQWPAALLSGLGTPWNTLQPEGVLSVSGEALSVEWIEGRIKVGGNARIEASAISSRLSTLRPMGSYRITLYTGASATVANPLSAAIGSPRIELETLEGALLLSGSGQWVGSHLRFDGVASAAPDREAALANLLNIIGRRNGARTIITVG